MTSLREMFLTCEDKRRECVTLPAWNNAKVWLRVLSGLEMEAAFRRSDAAGVHSSFGMVVSCAEDEHGERIFKDGDEMALAAKPYTATLELRRAAMAVNGYGDAAAESAEKN